MKIEEIHEGLDKKEIRDFLGKQFNKVDFVNSIKIAEEKLKEAELNLKNARIREGIIEIIKEFGWWYFDDSDIIENYNEETFTYFIGTEEEIKTLRKKVKEC